MLNQIRKGKKYQLENLKEVLPDVQTLMKEQSSFQIPMGS